MTSPMHKIYISVIVVICCMFAAGVDNSTISTGMYTIKPYVINLETDALRWQNIQKYWEGIFNLTRFPAIDKKEIEKELHIDDTMSSIGAIACKRSHLALLHYLRDLTPRQSVYTVMEDDVLPIRETWDTYYPALIEFLNNATGTTDWDVITLDPFVHMDHPTFKRYNHFLLEVSCVRNMGMIIYSSNFIHNKFPAAEKKDPTINRDASHGFGLENSIMCNPKVFKLLTPRTLLVRQECNETHISHTSNVSTQSWIRKFWKTKDVLNRVAASIYANESLY